MRGEEIRIKFFSHARVRSLIAAHLTSEERRGEERRREECRGKLELGNSVFGPRPARFFSGVAKGQKAVVQEYKKDFSFRTANNSPDLPPPFSFLSSPGCDLAGCPPRYRCLLGPLVVHSRPEPVEIRGRGNVKKRWTTSARALSLSLCSVSVWLASLRRRGTQEGDDFVRRDRNISEPVPSIFNPATV